MTAERLAEIAERVAWWLTVMAGLVLLVPLTIFGVVKLVGVLT